MTSFTAKDPIGIHNHLCRSCIRFICQQHRIHRFPWQNNIDVVHQPVFYSLGYLILDREPQARSNAGTASMDS